MLRIEPFKAADFFRVAGRELRASEEHEWFARLCEERSFYARPDGTIGRSAFSAFDGEQILGSAGVILMFGIGSMWMQIDQRLADRPLWLHRTAMRLFATVKREAGVRRFETAIAVDRPKNRAWAKRLGFEYEGPAFGYGPNGETFMHYALINREAS